MRACLRMFALAAMAATAGCATVAHGSYQDVTVTSDPPGATVTVVSAPPGRPAVVRTARDVTPVRLGLPRRNAHITIRLQRDACPPAEIRLKRTVSGWTAGNLVFANPLSMQGMSNPGVEYPRQLLIALPLTFGIDVVSGAAYKLPDRVHVSLCGR